MSFIRVCASFNRPLRHRPTANHRAEEQLRKQNTRNRNYLAWMVNRKDELSFEDRVRLPSCQIFHLRSKFFLLFICCKHPIRLCFRNKASFRPVVYNSSIASQPVVTFFISKYCRWVISTCLKWTRRRAVQSEGHFAWQCCGENRPFLRNKKSWFYTVTVRLCARNHFVVVATQYILRICHRSLWMPIWTTPWPSLKLQSNWLKSVIKLN